MVKVVCGDCVACMHVGGAAIYQCKFTGKPLDKKVVEERIEIECNKFEYVSRMLEVRMKELVEVGITTVYGGGSVQLPKGIREELEIKDGDKILWIRKGMKEYTFRKVGYKPSFKAHYV